MNQVIQNEVKRIKPLYVDRSDNSIIADIKQDVCAGDALFFLLFSRYAEMLQIIFNQQATPNIDFDDFMLDLNLRLFTNNCLAIKSFNQERALFKTYLSRIAHNILYDMKAKELPTLNLENINPNTLQESSTPHILSLLDAIDHYPDSTARYILRKTIEGYKSIEIAQMLNNKLQEEGILTPNFIITPAYVNTIRSRATKKIRQNYREEYEAPRGLRYSKKLSLIDISDEQPIMSLTDQMAPCDELSSPRATSNQNKTKKHKGILFFIQKLYNLFGLSSDRFE